MSKDIRSYFKSNGFDSKGSSNPKTEIDSQNKKRNHRVLESDDENDDDVFQSKKKAKEPPTAAKEKKKPEVIVQVENFFGTKPVNQIKQKIVSKNPEENTETQSIKKPRGRQKKKEKEKRNSSEVAFESDPELEASILQADAEDLALTEKKNNGVASNGKQAEVVDEKGKSPKKEVKDKKSTPKKDTEDKKSTPKKDTQDKKKTPKKEVTLEIKPNKTPKQEKAEADNSLLSSEQKRRNAEAYQKYLNRSGPKNPGSKTIPQGTPTCLQGLAFVITGVLDSLEREEATELIKKCGGRVTSAVSKKTDYMVVGEEPGVSKIQKAESFGTKKIDEDGLLELIRKSAEAESEKDSFIESTPEKASKASQKKTPRKRVASAEEAKCHPTPAKKAREASKKTEKNTDKAEDAAEGKGVTAVVKPPDIEKKNWKNFEKTGGDMLWVDKYKPKSTKNIVGQMGEKSNVKKLMRWLQNWHKIHSKNGKKSARPAAPWAQNDDGCYFKCALLSGPPGVGKTTTIHLVCKELGLDVVEFNASDTRSKRLLQDEVSEILCSKSVRGFLQGSGESFQKHVLVMDEVDGMAGNEDRGGIQELIQLIKDTKIPIVGICNDRNHPKMRALVNYCYDLRFHRPRVEQIKSSMKSICFKENLDITDEALEELIIASNHDIRQTLHSLSLLASSQKQPSLEDAKKKGEEGKKSLNLSPWEVTRRVFSASEHEKMSFTDKTDLFFQDYNMVPLFVHDTYLRVNPHKAKKSESEKLELISEAADSLALGDVVERAIRSRSAWNLLPVQAVFSSVLPGHHMSGHVQGQVQFPVWLGKNTKSIRYERLLQELSLFLRLTTTVNKQALNLDYLSYLRNAIVSPLLREGPLGVRSSVDLLISYYLTKIDLDTILELSSWPEMTDSFSEVDPKVKAALSRTLSKEARFITALRTNPKFKGDEYYFKLEYGEEGMEGMEGMEDTEDTEETESDSLESNPMIKVGKPKAKKETSEKRNKEEKKAASKKGKK